MLKLKQVLQAPINSSILKSISLSLITYLAINLINEPIILRQEQERAALQNLGVIRRAQGGYQLEWQDFSDSIEELGIGTVLDSENYCYRIYRGIQTTLNDYLFLDLDKIPQKSSIISEYWTNRAAKKLPIISSDIVMIAAQPKKAGLKTYIALAFTCSHGHQMGTPDCPDDSVTSAMLYESEQPLTPPPNRLRLNVFLPFPPCYKTGCIGELFPTPEGFRKWKRSL